MDVPARLAQLGWVLPQPPKPIAAYVPGVRCGELLFISGQLPWRDGKLLACGKIPSSVSIEEGQGAAAQCAVHGLAVAGGELGGDWERIVRVVRVGVFVQSDHDFTEQAMVANGASDLLQKIFGEFGRHARAAVGVNALPLNAAVEVEFLFQVR
ncbi:MAG TPA: RidA family protein [Tepidisphaeraceae bacterium]|nr:RidA family protein [Tepidisphaeraceae bacterium]